jgi:hypothetical protein
MNKKRTKIPITIGSRLILNFFKSKHFPRRHRPGRFHLGEMLYGRLPLPNVETT